MFCVPWRGSGCQHDFLNFGGNKEVNCFDEILQGNSSVGEGGKGELLPLHSSLGVIPGGAKDEKLAPYYEIDWPQLR
jgi:hypothetical protein